MPRRRKKKQPEYTSLAIAVDDYQVRTDAGFNLDLLGSFPHIVDEDEPVYSFGTDLELHGVCTDPEGRAGDRYEIALHGSSIAPPTLRMRIKDLHKRGKDGCSVYRKYRGVEHPVYEEPPAIAYLHKVRGEARWSVWVQVAPQMVTDSLILLSSGKPVYVSLYEWKENRQRQVRSLSVQSTDPAEE